MPNPFYNKTTTFQDALRNNSVDLLDDELDNIAAGFALVDTDVVQLQTALTTVTIPLNLKVNSNGAAGSAAEALGDFDNLIYTNIITCANTGVSLITAEAPIPADCKTGSALTLKIYFYGPSTAAGSVRFYVTDYKFAVGEYQLKQATGTHATTSLTAPVTQDVLRSVSHTLSVVNANDMIHICIKRDSAHADDDYGAAAHILGATLTYTRLIT